MSDSETNTTVTVVWLSGGSCEGCSMAALGAAAPGVETLLLGQVPGLPPVRLLHPLVAFEAGEAYIARLEQAAAGLFAPLVLVVEGSIFAPDSAGIGFFSGMGERHGRPRTITDWVDQLAPVATAVVAIGTCATWGGVPAARGNPTGAMSLAAYLGDGFHSTGGLPIINIPGCAPPGENFVETLIYLLLHLTEQAPLELDEANRPAWLYRQQTVPQSASSAIPIYGSETAVACRVPEFGWMNHVGGCTNVGGSCPLQIQRPIVISTNLRGGIFPLVESKDSSLRRLRSE
jgi:hydrogenase small subunit